PGAGGGEGGVVGEDDGVVIGLGAGGLDQAAIDVGGSRRVGEQVDQGGAVPHGAVEGGGAGRVDGQVEGAVEGAVKPHVAGGPRAGGGEGGVVGEDDGVGIGVRAGGLEPAANHV